MQFNKNMPVLVSMINATDQPADSVSAVQARRRLGELLNRVALRGDEITITRDGKPLARLVAVDGPRAQRAPLDLRAASGLGKSTWHEADAAVYVAAERDTWD